MKHVARFCVALVAFTGLSYLGEYVYNMQPNFFLGYLSIIAAAVITYGFAIYEG